MRNNEKLLKILHIRRKIKRSVEEGRWKGRQKGERKVDVIRIGKQRL